MKKHGSGISNLESSALKVSAANYVGRKYRKLVIALWLMAASLLTAADKSALKPSLSR